MRILGAVELLLEQNSLVPVVFAQPVGFDDRDL